MQNDKNERLLLCRCCILAPFWTAESALSTTERYYLIGKKCFRKSIIFCHIFWVWVCGQGIILSPEKNIPFGHCPNWGRGGAHAQINCDTLLKRRKVTKSLSWWGTPLLKMIWALFIFGAKAKMENLSIIQINPPTPGGFIWKVFPMYQLSSGTYNYFVKSFLSQ